MSATTTPVLAGAALKAEATRLAIPGRSKMTADQLREAVAATLAVLATAAYVPEEDENSESGAELADWAAEASTRAMSERGGTPVPDQRPRAMVEAGAPADALSDPTWGPLYGALFDHLAAVAPVAPITPTVFAARWGKRKPSLNGRTRRANRR